MEGKCWRNSCFVNWSAEVKQRNCTIIRFCLIILHFYLAKSDKYPSDLFTHSWFHIVDLVHRSFCVLTQKKPCRVQISLNGWHEIKFVSVCFSPNGNYVYFAIFISNGYKTAQMSWFMFHIYMKLIFLVYIYTNILTLCTI